MAMTRSNPFPTISMTLVVAAALVQVLTAGAGTARAGTFYVDNSAGSGCSNAAGAGSEANPFCTIAFGISRISGGDTLFVKTGTYAESLNNITGPSGSPGSPTVISAHPGHTPVIDNGGAGRVQFNGVSYMTFQSFVVTDMNQGIFVTASSNVIIQDNTVHHIEQEGIHVRQNSSDVLISGNTVHNIGLIDLNGEGLYIGTGSGGPLDNTHHVTVTGNFIYDTTDECIELKPGTHDFLVEGNSCRNTGTDFTSLAVGRCIEFERQILGAQSWSGNPNHVIRNNVCHSMGTAIRVGSGATVYNNLIFDIDAGHYGIRVENRDGDSYPREVYHNTIDVPNASNAVSIGGGTTDLRNNIGPSGGGNLAVSDGFFVSRASGDYRLAPGAAPIDAGVDLTHVVATDIDGNPRSAPDLGAYEFALGGAADTEPPLVVITAPVP